MGYKDGYWNRRDHVHGNQANLSSNLHGLITDNQGGDLQMEPDTTGYVASHPCTHALTIHMVLRTKSNSGTDAKNKKVQMY